jgi:MFS family permease
MSEGSQWEDRVCNYCGERMHHSQLQRHIDLVHASVVEAERTVGTPSESEWRSVWKLFGVWFTTLAAILIAQHFLAFDGEWFGWLIVVLVFSVIPGFVIIYLTVPEDIKQKREKAFQIMRMQEYKCEICDVRVPLADLMKHFKRYHPEQVPFEYFRAATLVVFLASFLGGMLVLFWLAQSDMFDRYFGVGTFIWAVFNGAYIAWIFYMSQVGELRHVRKMRAKWEESKFDPGNARPR